MYDVIDATKHTVFLADATRYAGLLFVLPFARGGIFADDFKPDVVFIVGDLEDERVLVLVLALALGAQRAPVTGDAVPVDFFLGFVEVLVLGAFVSAIGVGGGGGGANDIVLGLWLALRRWRADGRPTG